MKRLIIAICFLSVFDAVCTAAGVTSGEVIEAIGLLASAVMTYPWLVCGLVCAGVCGLMWWIYSVRRSAGKWLPFALSAVLIERIVIAAVHIVGITNI